MYKTIVLDTNEGPASLTFKFYSADRIAVTANHRALQEALNTSCGGEVLFAALPASELILLGKELEKEYGEVADVG